MIKIDDKKCTGCGVCIKICPRDVLRLENKKAVVVNYPECLECGACRLNCEFYAIDLTKGTGCLAAIIKEDILKIASKGTGCCGGSSGCC